MKTMTYNEAVAYCVKANATTRKRSSVKIKPYCLGAIKFSTTGDKQNWYVVCGCGEADSAKLATGNAVAKVAQ
jgi:hypothetical protein